MFAPWPLRSGPLPGGSENRWRNTRIVLRDAGALVALSGALMLLPLLVSLVSGEYFSVASFAIAAAVTAWAGSLTYRACRDAPEPSRRHAMLIAATGWLACACFGALPYLIAGHITADEAARALSIDGGSSPSSLVYFRNPLHALFESMSGFTTTGLSMAVHEPTLGYGLLFYRSLTQWVGGAGVIVLSLAIIPRPQINGVLELYQSETAGMKVRPGILGTARAIWSVYLGLTLLAAAFLAIATFVFVPDMGLIEGVFHAVNHAMTGLATGGFSTLDDSIAGYRSYAMEMAHLAPMLIGAIALPLHYKFVRGRRWGILWRDPQFRLLCLMCLGGAPLLSALLRGNPGVPDPVREGIFQFVSGLTGTGWQTSNIAVWNSGSLLVMAWCAMFVSGSAGSTVGGVKLIRAYLVGRAVIRQVHRIFLPQGSVLPFRVGERNLSAADAHREVADAASFCLLYAVILMASVLATAQVLGDQFSLGAIMFECSSAQGTVGLSSGITDPGMPALIEALFILQMWVGRLEIFPVLILLTALCSRRARG